MGCVGVWAFNRRIDSVEHQRLGVIFTVGGAFFGWGEGVTGSGQRSPGAASQPPVSSLAWPLAGAARYVSRVAIRQAPMADQPRIQPTMTVIMAQVGIGGISSAG